MKYFTNDSTCDWNIDFSKYPLHSVIINGCDVDYYGRLHLNLTIRLHTSNREDDSGIGISIPDLVIPMNGDLLAVPSEGAGNPPHTVAYIPNNGLGLKLEAVPYNINHPLTNELLIIKKPTYFAVAEYSTEDSLAPISRRQLTIQQIEEKLGYPIEVVEE